jgi:hypothetical protein
MTDGGVRGNRYRPIYSQSNSKVDGPGMYFELVGNRKVRDYSVGERTQVSGSCGCVSRRRFVTVCHRLSLGDERSVADCHSFLAM